MLLLLSSSPVAFDPKIFLVVVLVSGEENDASSSSWCRCASSRGGGRGAGRTIGRRPRLLHISMNPPQERNTANRTWPGLMRSMLSDIASFLFPFSFFLSLSLSRAQSVFDVCFYEDSVGERVHKSERIEREEGCCCCCCCSENKKRKCGVLLWRSVLFFSSRYILFSKQYGGRRPRVYRRLVETLSLFLSHSYSLGSATVNSSSPNGGAFFE